MSGIGRKQTPEIREIRYRRLPRPVDSLEITTIEALRQGARESEFTGPQRINFELIVWIERGTITHEVDFARYELGPGDVLWVHTGQVQRWGDIAAVDGIVCMMPATALDTALTDRLDRIGGWARSHWPADGPGAAQDFAMLLSHYRRSRDLVGHDAEAYDAAMVLLTSGVLMMLASHDLGDATSECGGHELLWRFRAEVDRHHAQRRSTRWYARRLGYSERTLHRVVLAHLGVTPRRVIEDRMVLEAKRMLVHESGSISTVARSLGFDDQSNFTKVFKRSTGLTPGEFRASSR